MNKKLSNGLAIILPNKKTNLFVMFVIILGIISGSIFLMVINENDKSTVINQITTFMKNINDNNINNFNALKSAIIENLIFIILVWILGMSIIGVIFNIFFIYMKGFMIGFSISSFILTYKYKGIIASVIYAFPTSVINIIVALILGSYSIIFTINLWKVIFMKDKNYNTGRFFKKYLLILGITAILVMLSSVTESYLVPSIFKVIIKLFI